MCYNRFTERGKETEKPSEKKLKKLKKMLDKLPKIWYNKDTPKEKIKN